MRVLAAPIIAPLLIRSSPRPVSLPHPPPGGQADGVHHRRQQPCAESPAHVHCFEAVQRDGVLRHLHADGVPPVLQPVPDTGLPDGVLQGERAHGGDGAAVAGNPECSKHVFQLQRCPGGPPLEAHGFTRGRTSRTDPVGGVAPKLSSANWPRFPSLTPSRPGPPSTTPRTSPLPGRWG